MISNPLKQLRRRRITSNNFNEFIKKQEGYPDQFGFNFTISNNMDTKGNSNHENKKFFEAEKKTEYLIFENIKVKYCQSIIDKEIYDFLRIPTKTGYFIIISPTHFDEKKFSSLSSEIELNPQSYLTKNKFSDKTLKLLIIPKFGAIFINKEIEDPKIIYPHLLYEIATAYIDNSNIILKIANSFHCIHVDNENPLSIWTSSILVPENPFRSRAQQRYFYWKAGKGSRSKSQRAAWKQRAARWSKHTRSFKSLPQYRKRK